VIFGSLISKTDAPNRKLLLSVFQREETNEEKQDRHNIRASKDDPACGKADKGSTRNKNG